MNKKEHDIISLVDIISKIFNIKDNNKKRLFDSIKNLSDNEYKDVIKNIQKYSEDQKKITTELITTIKLWSNDMEEIVEKHMFENEDLLKNIQYV